MKIIGNVGNGIKLVNSILKLKRYIPKLDALKSKGDLEGERALIAEAESVWIEDLERLFDMHFDISGKENIPEGPCVFIANHQAYGDLMAMLKATEGKQVGFISKKEFRKTPILGDWILRVRGLFINRGDARDSLKTIQEGADLVKQGFSMVIFPEGKRSCGEGMDAFKPGSMKLATRAGAPIVPVTINGTYRMFEERGVITKGQTATVIIHPAIETAGMDRRQQAELSDRVESIIKSALPKKGEGYIHVFDK